MGEPVAAVRPPAVTRPEAAYVDTDSLALAEAKVTLRRRTGGDDAGWHLRRPKTGDLRIELRRPLGPSIRTVPPERIL